MKTFRIVLASSETLDGRACAIHMGEHDLTGIVDRDLVDRSYVPRYEAFVREQFGGARRLARPMPRPFLSVCFVPADGLHVQLTQQAIIRYVPRDVASPRLLHEATLLANDVMRYYVLPQVAPVIAHDLLARTAS
ncbi:hypothetical protein ITP53_11515 [Nonomuraea sp. K274]|uniref:Uncharacterized protein n=1 Tax=Nonomuraea cypriaca TaxID=1187855 RepID=A0A931EYD1_9ACTN|nr:hypothetical protein [Nonomuraea cypriaca]MBF8186367.1 hypothetical protein [Nonomuraea cypriaca]